MNDITKEEIIFEGSALDVSLISQSPSKKDPESGSSRLHFFKKDSQLNTSKDFQQPPSQPQKQRVKAGTLNGLISYLTDPEMCSMKL